MKLHSIRLEHWRSYLQPREFHFGSGRIQVLHGLNGSGKSTLSAAIHGAFFQSYKSMSESAKALQPWGKTLAPKVEIQFSVGGRRFRLAKQYLQGKQAQLWEQRGEIWDPLASHEAAEEQLLSLLDLDESQAAVLWARQGSLEMPLAGESVRAAVQQSLGLQASGAAARLLEKAIETEFARYYTPTGKLKTGSSEPALTRLTRELGDLQNQATQAQKDLENLEAWQSKLSAGTEQEAQIAAQITLAADRLAAAEKASQQFQDWQMRSAAVKPELEKRMERLATLLKADKAVADCHKEIAKLQARWAELEAVTAEEAELSAKIAALQSPTAEELERLTQLQTACHLVEASIGAARVEVLLRPQGGGETLIQGEPNVEVELPGYGWIEARVPNSGGKELAARRAALRAELPLDVDLEDLRNRLRQAQSWTKDWERLHNRRENERENTALLREEKKRQLAALPAVDATQRDLLTTEVHLWDHKNQALEEERKQLPDDPQRTRLERQARLDQLRAEAAQVREDQAALRQAIQSAIAQAPYRNSNQIAERLELTKQDYEREKLRVNAILLLRQTLQEEKQNLLSRFTEPVAERAAELLEILAGRPWGRVQISSGLQPQFFHPLQHSSSVGLHELSGGEGEQVHLAVRLALAEVLSKSQPQMVLLDDVLTATDQSRLERLITYLEAAQDRLQILILTCHPERFSSLGDKADWIALDSKA